jgi:hypothetical protein
MLFGATPGLACVALAYAALGGSAFAGADLSGSGFLHSSLGAAYYSAATGFEDTNFDQGPH